MAELVCPGGNRLHGASTPLPSSFPLVLWSAVIKAALRRNSGWSVRSEWGCQGRLTRWSSLHLPVPCACESDQRWPSSRTGRTKEGERKSNPERWILLEPGICLTHICLSTQDLSKITQQYPLKLSQCQLPCNDTVRRHRCRPPPGPHRKWVRGIVVMRRKKYPSTLQNAYTWVISPFNCLLALGQSRLLSSC